MAAIQISEKHTNKMTTRQNFSDDSNDNNKENHHPTKKQKNDDLQSHFSNLIANEEKYVKRKKELKEQAEKRLKERAVKNGRIDNNHLIS